MKITNHFLLRVAQVGQRGAVSTMDIAELFIDRDLYNKIYCGLGSGKKEKAIKLSADEVRKISFAITAMSNTFLDAAKHLPKVPKEK